MKFGAVEDEDADEDEDEDEDFVPPPTPSALANARSTHMPVSCLNPALFGRTSRDRMSR